MSKDVLIGRNLKGITDREDFSVENWPSPDTGALSPNDLALFLKRKEAVRLYLQGTASATIYTTTGVHPRFLNRTIRERCMHPHPDGRDYGWRALVPGIHIVKYRRKTQVHADSNGRGAAGARVQLKPEATLGETLAIFTTPAL
jgi:hypothetical protein